MQRVSAGVGFFPVRTRTLPPATHTNAVVLGRSELTVVDPGSPWVQEQSALVEALEARGLPVRRILLTHHHDDHVAGLQALIQASPGAALAAHPRTAELLGVRVDEELVGGEQIDCGGLSAQVIHTPGHAPGHLALALEDGVVVAGDMVAGLGTIALVPEDGTLEEYLASLQRLLDLGASALVPSHGPLLHQPQAVLSMYIAHRHQRSAQLRETLDRRGGATPHELVDELYAPRDEGVRSTALGEVRVHLAWMRSHGLARRRRRSTTWEVA